MCMEVNLNDAEYSPFTHSDLSSILLHLDLCLEELNFMDNINLDQFHSGFSLVLANGRCSLEIRRLDDSEFEISLCRYLPVILWFGSGCVIFQKT